MTLAASPALAGAIISFDAPGATATTPQAVNASGVVAGYYVDESDHYHSFIRAVDGTFTTFDEPQATKHKEHGTFAQSINSKGAVVGYYNRKGMHLLAGFLRTPDGKFKSFAATDVGLTFARSVNARGVIAGDDTDATGFYHGFVRAADGTITNFDAPGAGTSGAVGYGTFVSVINTLGAVAGSDLDSGGVEHGFVRNPDGTFATFDAPGADTSSGHGTWVESMNDDGAVAGYYSDSSNVYHAFVRAADGMFVTFDAPGARGGTVATAIDSKGSAAGVFSARGGIAKGFVRTAGGSFKTFIVNYQSIAVSGINNSRTVTGNSNSHGFVGNP